ncbi:MAG: phosphoribosylformylglycinamidine synthase [Gammaproteobacteria bacterium]
MLLTLVGQSAFSEFQLHKLLSQLQLHLPELNNLTVNYCYFIYTSSTLTPEQQNCLHQLLETTNTATELPANSLLVTPRPGTISPWSSKATDILHNAGLASITRIERGRVYTSNYSTSALLEHSHLLYDRMTEVMTTHFADINTLFSHQAPQAMLEIDILKSDTHELQTANQHLGLALNAAEIEYLHENFKALKRNPTDAELMMFAQANSEHCRHKTFNALWEIDGEPLRYSLFKMIRYTYEHHNTDILSAYSDNAAIIRGHQAPRWMVDSQTQQYRYHNEPIHIVMKVETHNHPTAIAPFPGASTGAGGEIRDEGATGRGAKPKAGLVGYSVSNLHLPNLPQPWEMHAGKPDNIVSALTIMQQAPLGAAAFNNEFGRPNLCGYFRTYEHYVNDANGKAWRGYHKPIMLAGGLGNIREQHALKQPLPDQALIIVLGGPGMQIGLGGGAASSMTSGNRHAELDYASVQRDNPEMQRRCQEVIDQCWALGDANPILSIHDVGAGGLANAIPELVNDSQCGMDLRLRAIPSADQSMSPLAIWCNESQERYVLAIHPQRLAAFEATTQRERCPFAVVGTVTAEQQLRLYDEHFNNYPVDIANHIILGSPPRATLSVTHANIQHDELRLDEIDLTEAATRVLQLPCVADKNFLIFIGDRTVGGMSARDQLVGPWQTAVSDVAVTLNSFQAFSGEAMAIGERAPLALINAPAAGRIAIAEAITNIAAAPIAKLSDIKLSANWMVAADYPGEAARLYDTVQAVALELCPALDLTIPVGKDSTSMRTRWEEEGKAKQVTAPLSLVVSAFAPVADVRHTLTPLLNKQQDTTLLFIDLGQGQQRLGGSALAQVFQQLGDEPPDVDDPQLLKQFFSAIQALNNEQLLLAYHDRSDGGLFTTLCEMSFASHTGLTITLDSLGSDPLASLFNEELGAVIQVATEQLEIVKARLTAYDLAAHTHVVGHLNTFQQINFFYRDELILGNDCVSWHRLWSATSYHIQATRDNPNTAKQEFNELLDYQNPGLHAHTTFDIHDDISAPYISVGHRPKVAILREQGVNGHLEMAAAFDRVGFASIDVHMSDILAERVDLAQFHGLVACGGFSYGDVLGAGRGWASSILFHEYARQQFQQFFARSDTFTLGVCNGCQMLSQLSDIIPGSKGWPRFVRNISAQFEARLVMVEVTESNSILFKGMQGSRVPIVVAHGEGRVHWSTPEMLREEQIALRYVDNYGLITQAYPANPNGSPDGITGICNSDGRITLLMPHPERVFRAVQFSWCPPEWRTTDSSPWLRMFANARVWLG